MKAFGHTKTLFIEGGKYKWSRKYDYCISCKMVEYVHKGHGLCSLCFNREQRQKQEYKDKIKVYCKEYHKRTYSPVKEEEKKKVGRKKIRTYEEKKKIKDDWYQRKKFIIKALRDGKNKHSRGQGVMQYRGYYIDIQLKEGDRYAERLFLEVKKHIDLRIKRLS